jgi:uncharacterized protein (TIGR02466 family)
LPATVPVTQQAALAELALVSSTPAFAAHVDHYTVRDHLQINADLLRAIATWRAADPGIAASNRQGWHSPRTFFARTEPIFVRLQRQIKSALVNSLKRHWPEYDANVHRSICDGWININPTGSYNVVHDHGGAHLSGVYYVSARTQQDEDRTSGLLEILSPNSGSPRLPGGRPLMGQKVVYEPSAGHMIIFPAHLLHSVHPNAGRDPRISIAFNLRVLDN